VGFRVSISNLDCAWLEKAMEITERKKPKTLIPNKHTKKGALSPS
jgi:hypothetical protein